VGRGTVLYTAVRDCYDLLLGSTVLSVDPSIGSHSSQPGYAVYRSGELVTSGELSISPSWGVPARLQLLGQLMRDLVTTHEPDVLVYEDIAPRRYGGGNASAHASLLKAVGVVLSTPGPHQHVPVKPTVWRHLMPAGYVKSDKHDAEAIGLVALQLAQHIRATHQKRRTRRSADAT